MNKLLILFLSIFFVFVVSAQTFKEIPCSFTDGTYSFALPTAKQCSVEIKMQLDKKRMEINSCSSVIKQSSLPIEENIKGCHTKLLYSPKIKLGFLFCEFYNDMSLGVKVYKLDGEKVSEISELPFVAYTSENGERMNYNSILPYLSIIRSGARTLMFFNNPISVMNPNKKEEQILESKDFYFELSSQGFELKKY
ncbi:MAG: hypothetical protein IJ180_01145 [Bacteroidales bacterium]|nr:hypothetical protein [Bacteroidales bacterium]